MGPIKIKAPVHENCEIRTFMAILNIEARIIACLPTGEWMAKKKLVL